MNRNGHHKQVEDIDIDAELASLEKRKAKLMRLLKLRHEVGNLEREEMDSTAHAQTLKIISEEVCKHYNMTFEHLTSPSREESVAKPRQVAFYIARELKRITFENIGRSFKKDHGTVMFGCKVVKNRIDTDDKFALDVETIKSKCQSRLTAQPL